MKCEECDKPKATYRCVSCGAYFCESCADIYEGTCMCARPQNIQPIKKEKENKEC